MSIFIGGKCISGGTGLSEEQLSQLDAAYNHSQSTHVQPSDIPTTVAQLTDTITYSKTAAQAKVYKNGVLLNTFTLTGEANIGNRLLIAGGFEQTKSHDNYSYGRAMFQDLKIYNKIKTAEELLEEYNILANNGGLLD